MKFTYLFTFLLFFTVMGCNSTPGEIKEDENAKATTVSEAVEPELDQASKIVNAAIERHGGELYTKSFVEFDFRNRHYTSRREGGKFTYERIFEDEENNSIRDVLSNDGFFREINGEKTELPEDRIKAYSNSVNSVLYFVLLPYYLNDGAVNKTYLGESTIKGTEYHKIQITFDEEGGGKDHEDVFVYWFNKETYTLDYLAYNYIVEGGGARFREAYNVRTIEGIRFADFINYKPIPDTKDVTTFDKLFEEGQLKEVSRIDSENVRVELLDL